VQLLLLFGHSRPGQGEGLITFFRLRGVGDEHLDHRKVGAKGGQPDGDSVRIDFGRIERDRPLALGDGPTEGDGHIVPTRELAVGHVSAVEFAPASLHAVPQGFEAKHVRRGLLLVVTEVEADCLAVRLLADLPVELFRRLAPSQDVLRHRRSSSADPETPRKRGENDVPDN